MNFTYTAFDSAGLATSGEIDAGTPSEAAERLRRKGLFVDKLVESQSTTTTRAGRTRNMRFGKRLKHLAMFSRQLEVLISAGTPLLQGLSAVEKQAIDPQWREVMRGVTSRVEEGVALSDAMRQYPGVFDPVSLSLIAAGETSGDITAMLNRLSILCRKQLHLHNSILGALVYPCLLITLGSCVLLTMLMFVLPRFSDMFQQLDSPLPPTTKFLLWCSNALWSTWFILAPLAVVGALAIHRWLSRPAGRVMVNEWLLRTPKLGVLLRNLMTARLARMLGVLLESQVPLLDALKLTRDSARLPRYIELLAQAEDAVTRGEPVSSVLASSKLITPCVQEATRTGEQTGRLGAPLIQMAEFLEEENDVMVKSLTTLIEPAILIVLGIMVAIMALSMFLPLFDLVGSVQHG